MKEKKLFRFFCLVAVLAFLFVPRISAIDEDEVKAVLNTMNDQLVQMGKDFQIEKVEFSTHDEVGPTVYANDRTHQLADHWMPFDPRRHGGQEIFWLIEQVDQTADVPWADAVAAVGRAMNTWGTTPCANIPLVELPDLGMDWGVVQWMVGMGGFPGWYADITHAGWLPWIFFEIIGGPGGGNSILGVTFTFTWTAEPNVVAFREIYYNDAFTWGIDIRLFDIESIVLHEVGHGLSLGHFGKIFRTPNGKLRFAPRAVMNAIYWDIQHELLGTDNGSFCSIWASWPNH
jgi:hypothetical protein